MWPNSPAKPLRPRTQLAVDDQPAADAGAERDQDDVVDAGARPELPLGHRRARGVVVDLDPHFGTRERGPQPSGHVEVGDAVEVRRRLQHALRG